MLLFGQVRRQENLQRGSYTDFFLVQESVEQKLPPISQIGICI